MRDLFCGEVTVADLDREVSLCGWVQRRRDHGGVIFLDIRDHHGVVQVVFDPDREEAFAVADSCRNEYVVALQGKVRERPKGTENPEMPTGQVEVLGHKLTVLNSAETPAIQLDERQEVGEDVRLRHRFLDLRRPEMQHNLRFRARFLAAVRAFLNDLGFVDIETPTLTRATPEGARDYLIPSRTHQGSFFALPQSPQLFKQTLMASGFDRYYQIARCFRDEDLRADRQPEFTQIDIEASFVDTETVIQLNEKMMRELFKQMLDVDLPEFTRLSWDDSMRRYGTDCPDLRNPLQLVDIDDLVRDVEFNVLREPACAEDGRVAVLRVPGAAGMSRGQIDAYTEMVGTYGAKGLAYIKVQDIKQGMEGLQSPILKFLGQQAVESILERSGCQSGDLLFFGAGHWLVTCASLGALRDALGADLDLLEEGWQLCWVTDFPVFLREPGKPDLQSVHHPFTAPACSVQELADQPEQARAKAYDLVLNGRELGGGSIRIHDADTQLQVLELLGIGREEAERQFGFLLRALRSGCPPHGGIAYGVDRIVMMMLGQESIRDVIAFPKTQQATCLLTEAPGQAGHNQLAELGIQLSKPADKKQNHGGA